MSKGFLFKFIILGAVFVAALMFLLSFFVEPLNGFTLGWAGFIVAVAGGVACLFRGLFQKNAAMPMLKKLSIYFGVGLFVVAGFLLINELAIKDEASQYIIPAIAVAVAGALLLGFIAVGGKKWDTADNKKVGYKSYHERSADEKARRK
jgi:uncharacterized protein YhhL (DUF1145 family)